MALKERLQITLRPGPDEDDGHEWVWGPDVVSKSQASKNGVLNVERRNGELETLKVMFDPQFTQLPPGVDINNVRYPDTCNMPLSVAGTTDVSGHQAALEHQDSRTRGTCLHPLGPIDDQYTGEHVDLFYGVAYGTDGDPDGFCERNNYLDRL